MALENTRNDLPDVGFVRLRTILALIPVARSTWWTWVAAGKAPKPVKLSPNVTAWRVEDIRNLIAQFGANAEAAQDSNDIKTTPETGEANDVPEA